MTQALTVGEPVSISAAGVLSLATSSPEEFQKLLVRKNELGQLLGKIAMPDNGRGEASVQFGDDLVVIVPHWAIVTEKKPEPAPAPAPMQMQQAGGPPPAAGFPGLPSGLIPLGSFPLSSLFGGQRQATQDDGTRVAMAHSLITHFSTIRLTPCFRGRAAAPIVDGDEWKAGSAEEACTTPVPLTDEERSCYNAALRFMQDYVTVKPPETQPE